MKNFIQQIDSILFLYKAFKSLKIIFDPSVEGQPYVVNHSTNKKYQSFRINSIYKQNINRLNFR